MESLSAEIERFVAEYNKMWSKPIKLKIVAALFAKRLKREAGVSPRTWVGSCDLFWLIPDENGGLSLQAKSVQSPPED